jgi:hypothetical protein
MILKANGNQWIGAIGVRHSQEIKVKRRGKFALGVLLLQDNGPVHKGRCARLRFH